jgi:hypothetical protein
VTLALKRILPNDYDVIHDGEMGPWLTRGRRLDPLACTECQMSICLRRREFVATVGGAVAWPLVASAQQPPRVRRIGALMAYAESDSEAQAYIAAFREGLQKLGWTEEHSDRLSLVSRRHRVNATFRKGPRRITA